MKRTAPERIAHALVRLAALRAPPHARDRMAQEWEAELDQEAHREPGWRIVGVAIGAFSDAKTLRTIHEGEAGRPTMANGIGRWAGDVKLSLRGLLRTPGFTVVAVLTLALGIGGTAAIWTLVDRVVLDPLPYPQAERLVMLENQVPGNSPEPWKMSPAQWVYFTDHAESLDEIGVYAGTAGNFLTAAGPLRVRAVSVTAATLRIVGARAAVGRLFAEPDDQPGAERVVLLSHGFWERVLGSDPDVVGTVLSYSDNPVEVIGVLAEGVELPGLASAVQPELWFAIRIDRAGPFANEHYLPMIARLAPGATAESAEDEIGRLTAGLPDAFPRVYSQGFFDRYGFRTDVAPLKEAVLGDLGRNLWLIFGGVGLVLLIACANVANLFIVRAEGRRGEMAIRSALGAGRATLARYLLADGIVLALAGGTLALLVGYWGVPVLIALAPEDLPRIAGAGFDGGTVVFVLGLSLLVGVGLSAYPILGHSGSGVARVLASRSRGSSGGRDAHRLRSGLVVTQLALALTLVVASGLLMKTLRGLYGTDTGVDPEGVLVMDLHPTTSRYPDDSALWTFYDEVLDRVRALPGVTAAGMTAELPVADDFGCWVQGFEDQSVADRIEDAGQTTCAGQEPTTPGYFEAMGIPVLAGRGLEDADNNDPGRAAAVVSQAFAERFWPGESPIGKGVNPGGRTSPPFYHVVGVVGDVAARVGEDQAPLSQKAIAIYYPIRYNPNVAGNRYWWPGNLRLVVRTAVAEPSSLVPAIRAVVAELDREVPVGGLTDMEAITASAMTRISFVALLLGIAAAEALLLAAVGLYGMISYVVGRRTREIGMRMAIGARPGEVERMVVGQSLALAGAGLALGVVLAFATTGLMEGLLVGVRPMDPVVFVGASLLLALVAAVAAWIPARRAAHLDPIQALRAD